MHDRLTVIIKDGLVSAVKAGVLTWKDATPRAHECTDEKGAVVSLAIENPYAFRLGP